MDGSTFSRSLVRTVAPTDPVVTLIEAKAHLHVDTSGDDGRITQLINACTTYLDGANGILGVAIRPQTWVLNLPGFPDQAGGMSPFHADRTRYPNMIRMPLPPTISIDEIAYTGADGVDAIMSSSLYETFPGGARGDLIAPIDGQAWPTIDTSYPDAVRITFQCGYTSDQDALRSAVLLMLQSMFDSPGVVDIPDIVHTLIAPYRQRHFG